MTPMILEYFVGMGLGVLTSMIFEYFIGMGWGVITSMILEYVRDGVGCDNVNDTRVRRGS